MTIEHGNILHRVQILHFGWPRLRELCGFLCFGPSLARYYLAMTTTGSEASGFQQLLEEKEAQLLQVLRRPSHIAVEIRNLSRESSLLRAVRAALRRVHGDSFGNCDKCEAAISPRRLAAVPWALLCIRCLETADSYHFGATGFTGAALRDGA